MHFRITAHRIIREVGGLANPFCADSYVFPSTQQKYQIRTTQHSHITKSLDRARNHVNLSLCRHNSSVQ